MNETKEKLLEKVKTLAESIDTVTRDLDSADTFTKELEEQAKLNDQMQKKIELLKKYNELFDEQAEAELQLYEKQLIKERRMQFISDKYHITQLQVPQVPHVQQVQQPPPLPPPPPPPIAQPCAAPQPSQPESKLQSQSENNLQAVLSKAVNNRRNSMFGNT